MSPKKPSGAQGLNVRMFVRRGALRRFDRLKQATKDLPVAVEWDRREEERRSASEEVAEDARKAERRGDPSFTWKVADFVVVESPRQREDGEKQEKEEDRISQSTSAGGNRSTDTPRGPDAA